MSENTPIIIIEVVLVFGGALAFYFWQMRDLDRESKRRKARESDQHPNQ
jgi:hypothetical protein